MAQKLNASEQFIKEEYEKEGWEVVKPSWPDFIMIKGGEFKLVEAKRIGDRISRSQQESFKLLQKLGFPIELGFMESMVSGGIIKRAFDNKNIALKQTKKRQPSKWDWFLEKRTKVPVEQPFEPFDPKKHLQESGKVDED